MNFGSLNTQHIVWNGISASDLPVPEQIGSTEIDLKYPNVAPANRLFSLVSF